MFDERSDRLERDGRQYSIDERQREQSVIKRAVGRRRRDAEARRNRPIAPLTDSSDSDADGNGITDADVEPVFRSTKKPHVTDRPTTTAPRALSDSEEDDGAEDDGRNYMLSTLTPVDAPEGCGIFVDDEEETIATGGDAVILDNTYPHYIYNTADRDRICLMSECWHPALAAAERDALATLFAVKDRFTVLDLGMAPWGYGEDDLAKALKSGAVNDLDYWRRLDYEPPKRKAPKKKKVGASGRNKKKAAKSRAFG